MPPITRVKGMPDLLPPQTAAWQRLHALHTETAERYGYRLAEAPVLERTELFVRGVGAGTDIVDKEMFSFQHSDDQLTLRPEGTAGILRAALGANLVQDLRPIRLHYAGAMFRAERPQANRFRQFHQVGVEAIGERSAHLDVEVIELAMEFLRELGISDTTLQINSLGDREDRARYREALIAYYAPHEAQLCADCRRRLRVNPLRLLDCKRDAPLAEGAPRLEDSLGDGSTAYFGTVLEGLDAAGIEPVRNHRLVRGLDYYSDTAFEVWHGALTGAQNALFGGGRYDGLAEELGFRPTPGIGYAMGVERLLAVAEAEGAAPSAPSACDAVVLALTPAQALAAAAAARPLRAAGLRIVVDSSDRKLGPRLAMAERLGAAAVVIVGPEEVAAGTASVRDMRTRDQSTVALTELASHLRSALTPSQEKDP